MVNFPLRFNWFVQSKFQRAGRIADEIEQRDCRCVLFQRTVHLEFVQSRLAVVMYGKTQRYPKFKLLYYLCLVIKQTFGPLLICLRSSPRSLDHHQVQRGL